MNPSSRIVYVILVLQCIFFTACKPSKPVFQIANSATVPAKTPEQANTAEASTQTFTSLSAPKTVAFQAGKVAEPIKTLLPATNTTRAVNHPVLFQQNNKAQAVQKQIKDINDGPEKGPLRTISGIFLAVGMALLITAGILLLTGTSGAGLLAIIGGSSFIVGSLVTIYGLLTQP